MKRLALLTVLSVLLMGQHRQLFNTASVPAVQTDNVTTVQVELMSNASIEVHLDENQFDQLDCIDANNPHPCCTAFETGATCADDASSLEVYSGDNVLVCEIEESGVLTVSEQDGGTATVVLDPDDATQSITGMDVTLGTTGATAAGGIGLGDSVIVQVNDIAGTTVNEEGMLLIQVPDTTNNMLFGFVSPTNVGRFIIPEEGNDLATLNVRSMMHAGPWVDTDSMISCDYWGFDAIDCETGSTGADLGVQDDIQLGGSIYFEGAATPLPGGGNAFETQLAPITPTADRVVLLQDATGYVALLNSGTWALETPGIHLTLDHDNTGTPADTAGIEFSGAATPLRIEYDTTDTTLDFIGATVGYSFDEDIFSPVYMSTIPGLLLMGEKNMILSAASGDAEDRPLDNAGYSIDGGTPGDVYFRYQRDDTVGGDHDELFFEHAIHGDFEPFYWRFDADVLIDDPTLKLDWDNTGAVAVGVGIELAPNTSGTTITMKTAAGPDLAFTGATAYNFDNPVEVESVDVMLQPPVCKTLFAPSELITLDSDIPSIWRSNAALTISEVWCETDANTANIQLQKDDGSPVNMLSSNLACTSSEATTSTFVSTENVFADNQELDLVVVSTSGGDVARLSICWEWAY